MNNTDKKMQLCAEMASIESERITNGLAKRGLNIINREETQLFINISVEVMANKINLLYHIDSLNDDDVCEIIIQTSLSMMLVALAINGCILPKNGYIGDEMTGKLNAMQKYFSIESLRLTKTLRDICSEG